MKTFRIRPEQVLMHAFYSVSGLIILLFLLPAAAELDATGSAEASVQVILPLEELPSPPGQFSIPILPGGEAGLPQSAVAPPEIRLLHNSQWLYLGINGELVAPAPYAMPPDEVVLIVPNGNLIEFRLRSAFHNEMPFAVIAGNGAIQRREEPTPSAKFSVTPSLPALPKMWNFRRADGAFAMPSPGTLLDSGSSQNSAVTTTNAVGWALPSASAGHLIFPMASTARPDNVLWVVPTFSEKGIAAGFSLVHSGPLHSGTFLEVNADGRIVLRSGALNAESFADTECYWPARDADTGELTTGLEGHEVQVLGFEKGYAVLYRDNRPVSVVMPSWVF